MAVQTLIGHYITEIRRRTKYRYEGGHVTASVPQLPGIEAEGSSEDEAREAFLGLYIAWLLKQLDRGLPVPPLGEHDLNTDYNRQLFMRETGLTIPLLTEQPDPDQMWFWTPKWQEMEREAEADIAAGRTEHFESDEEFLASFPD
jgi:predicted RNase H-like HicB family nuclease